jgi:alkanesulfonate monooxygenase SsuD/methylene tetrahydromethanopterin reductase-like flavin-dependent oxidoreductase (luciferase family)
VTFLGVAFDGAGWHPAAWREPTAQPDRLFDPGWWVELAQQADEGGVDLLTFEDAFTLQSAHPFRPDDRTDQVRGRLDASLLAARVAPATRHVGLLPTVSTAHTEPFHVATKAASLDWVSAGRGGVRLQLPRQRAEAELFGRRALPDLIGASSPEERSALAQPLIDEAVDVVEVLRRLWDSWEDDAEIRDRATGRFIDRDKVHHIDFEGEHFSVRGPSITPRSPQGQPVVAMLAHATPVYELAARTADVVFTTPHDVEDVRARLAEIRHVEHRVGRTGPPLLLAADLLVLFADDAAEAGVEREHLDELDGGPLRTDAFVWAGDPDGLVDLIAEWVDAGLDGVRLRPARLPLDLDAIVGHVVPELRRRGLLLEPPEGATLRDRLGLERPPNRWTTAQEAARA